MKGASIGAWLFAGASVIAMSSGAHAQNTAAPAADPASAEIVVTGSRTIRNGDNNPSPATIVSTQDILQIQPGTLSNALNILPVFAGSRTTAANPTFNGSQTGGNASSNQLNLRNLGALRTLVLMDGYRVPPTSFNNVVDVDIIPQMLVQRVDTVTGGVSAVYGSDAVAGVVNYVLDKKFNGIRFEAEGGVSDRNDNARYQVGIAAGTSLFGGRGHLEGSFQIIREEGIEARSDRPWIHNWGVGGSGTAALPYILYPNVHQGNFAFGGLITNGVLAGQTFDANGAMRAFVPGTLIPGPGNLQIGGDGAYYDSQLIASLRSKQFFGRYDHELAEGLRAYVQVSGNIKRNQAFADPVQFNNFTFRAENAFLPAAARSRLAAGSTFTMSEIMGNYARLNNIARSRQYTGSVGLDGEFGNVDWGVNYTHGLAKLHTTMTNNVNNQRLAAALDAVVGPNGQVVCRAATLAATAAAYANCIPLNPFGIGASAGPTLFDYVLQPTDYFAKTVQDDVSAHLAVTPFALPAGDVRVALSGEWRKLSFRGNTTGPSSARADCTNLINCTGTGATPTLLWAFGFANSPKISQTVKEGAAEIEVPLLADAPLAKALSVNGAARYTSYNTSGNYWTWKVGGVWRVTERLRFRATRSRDIRAPTLYELFAPLNSVPINPVDRLTNLTPRVPSTDLSNPDLTAEIADTLTGGFSWSPVRGVSLTFDAYKIKINDAVAQVSGSNPALQDLCYASGGTSFYCSLQTRALGNFTNRTAANQVTGWFVKYLNFSNIETKGADFEVNFSSRLFNRPATFRLLTAYQPHAYYRIQDVPVIDQGNVAFGPTGFSAGAKWRVTAFARVSPFENFSIDLLERWRSAMKIGGDQSLIIQDNHIDDFMTTNVTLTYAFKKTVLGDAQLALNVSNLFDAKAPGGAYTGNGTRSGLRDGFVPGDDVVGRAYSLALRIRY